MFCHVGLVIEAKFVRFDVFFSDLSLGLVDFSDLTRFLFVLRIQVLTTSPFFGGQAETPKIKFEGR